MVEKSANEIGKYRTVVLERKFRSGWELGYGQLEDGSAWFVLVYDRPTNAWSTHCGPYSTDEQAKDWINAINDEHEQDAHR